MYPSCRWRTDVWFVQKAAANLLNIHILIEHTQKVFVFHQNAWLVRVCALLRNILYGMASNVSMLVYVFSSVQFDKMKITIAGKWEWWVDLWMHVIQKTEGKIIISLAYFGMVYNLAISLFTFIDEFLAPNENSYTNWLLLREQNLRALLKTYATDFACSMLNYCYL